MDISTNMMTVHTLNESMWETTDYDNIGSLVGEDNLICCNFNTPLLEELEEYNSMSDLD